MKSATASLFIVVLVGQSWAPCLAITNLFHRVSVSAATVSASQRLEVAPESFSNIKSSIICSLREWCDLWCHDQTTDQCFYSDLIVMPGYSEPNLADALTCYTRRHPDFATGAVIEGTEVHPVYAGVREKSNLVDGIYDRKSMSQCFDPNEVNDPWFMLDFRAPVTFRLVKFFAQPGGAAFMINRISNLELRVSVSPAATPGDFSAFLVFGFFTGPAVAGQEIIVEGASPVTARFVTVQKMGLTTNFQLCHIEVY